MNRLKAVNQYLVLIALILVTFVVWWFPYFLKGHLPFSEWGYGLIWGDWLSDRLFLVNNHVIPEWNPNNVLGVNYIGRDPFNNPLSLGNIFKFFFSNPKTEWLFALFFFLTILGTGTYAFLKSQEIKANLAAVGAVLITIYPKWMDDIYHGPGKFITAYSVVPWLLLLVFIMFEKKPRLIHFIGLGAGAAAIFLGSGAWVASVLLYLILPYFTYQFWRYLSRQPGGKGAALAKTIGGSAVALSVAAGLSAYLLLPLLDNLRLSSRSLYFPPVGYGLVDFAGLVFPWISRVYTRGFYDLPYTLPGIGLLSNLRFYFGILTIPLFISILSRPDLRRRYAFFWIWPMAMAFLFSKAGNAILPIMSFFERSLGAQSSENFLFFGFFFCANLVMMAALSSLSVPRVKAESDNDPFSTVPWAKRAVFMLAGLYLIAALGWITLWLLTRLAPTVFNSLLSNFSKPIEVIGVQLVFYSYFFDYFFYLILFSFLIKIAILLWFGTSRWLKKDYGLVILGVLLAADFLIYPKLIYPFTGSLDLRYSKNLEQNAFIQKHVRPTERVAAHHIDEKLPFKKEVIARGIAADFDPSRQWDPQRVYRGFKATNPDGDFYEPLFDTGLSYYPVTIHKQIYNYHESLLPDYFFDFDKALNDKNPAYVRQSWNAVWDPSSRLLDIAGISYLLWYTPLEDPRLKLVGTAPVGASFIYKNTKAVPKAYLAGRVEYWDRRSDLLLRLQEPAFDPRTTVTTENRKLARLFPTEKAVNPGGRGRVDIVKYGTNEIVMDVRTQKPTVLVVTDLFFPYWTAKIDGRPSDIYRVNAVFRGIPVGKGRHTIIMSYYNVPFHRGLKISMVSAIVTCILAGSALLRQSRKSMGENQV